MKRKFLIGLSSFAVIGALAAGFGLKANQVRASGPYSGGTGTEADPFLISTQTDWASLNEAVTSDDENASQEGVFFKLTQDIVAQTGIAANTESKPFAGTFDGDGHSVELTRTLMGTSNGLFCVNKGTIKNLTRTGRTSGTTKQGGICAINFGLIDNCVNKAEIATSGYYIGGIAGINGDGTSSGQIRNCRNEGHIYTMSTAYTGNANALGGIVGYAYSTAGAEVTGCVNEGLIEGYNSIGGIVGIQSQHSGMTVSNCINRGNVGIYGTPAETKFIGSFGGIIGLVKTAATDQTNIVTNCINFGSVTGYGTQETVSKTTYWFGIGGIAGTMYTRNVISYCVNLGDIEALTYMAGGIAGYGQTGNPSSIENCFSAGHIKANKKNAGGIMGRGSKFDISDCVSAATIECSTESSKIKGNGTGTLSNNTEYTISDNALTILRKMYCFECSDVDTEAKKTDMYSALHTALADLSGTDDATVLARQTLDGESTFIERSQYVERFCVPVSALNLFGNSTLADSNVVLPIIGVSFAAVTLGLVFARKRKKA